MSIERRNTRKTINLKLFVKVLKKSLSQVSMYKASFLKFSTNLKYYKRILGKMKLREKTGESF